jgi:hypothetical protein
MSVGHDGGAARVFDRGIKVIGKIGPEGRYAHGRAIPERPPATEEAAGRRLPRAGAPKLREQGVHGRPIPTPRICGILQGEGACQMVLVDFGVPAQGRDNRERHRGVVCPSPRGRPQRVIEVAQTRRATTPLEPKAGNDGTVVEKALPECVADG